MLVREGHLLEIVLCCDFIRTVSGAKFVVVFFVCFFPFFLEVRNCGVSS